MSGPTGSAPEAVVVFPAFGVPVAELERYDRQGCTVVDTTCGSVLNMWKQVRQYARDGFTAIIHGKVHHEETRATASVGLTAGASTPNNIIGRVVETLVQFVAHARGCARTWSPLFFESCDRSAKQRQRLR